MRHPERTLRTHAPGKSRFCPAGAPGPRGGPGPLRGLHFQSLCAAVGDTFLDILAVLTLFVDPEHLESPVWLQISSLAPDLIVTMMA